MPSYHIWTIGCQMNKAESDRLAGRLEELGYAPAASPAEADVVILNSCVVRQSAEDRIVNKIYSLRPVRKANPGALLAVTGCFVGEDARALKKRFPHIDYFFSAGGDPPWLEAPASPPLPAAVKPVEYLSISQGCNNFCTYCIVPYRRGRERSRPFQEIVCEARELARRGTKEIVLLGQNVDSYGQDLPEKPDLADLLGEMNVIPGIARLRFLTNHPKDMSDKLIGAIARLDKVCEHVNLPVQAGNDAILHAMGRGYTSANYLALVEKLRAAVPDIALSTDIIVGFPGETPEQFRETYDLIAAVNFATVHVAAYSTREGTAAARHLEDNVPAAEKKERLAAIERLQENVQTALNARLLGTSVEVLVEGKNKGKWYGRTRTDKLVFFRGKGDFTGKLVNIDIEKTSPWSLQGSTPPIVQEEK